MQDLRAASKAAHVNTLIQTLIGKYVFYYIKSTGQIWKKFPPHPVRIG